MNNNGMLQRLARLDAHHRTLISAAAGVTGFLLLQDKHSVNTEFIIAWNLFAVCMLLLSWNTLLHADPRDIRRTVRLQDTGRSAIFILLVFATTACFLAVGFLLGPAKGLTGERLQEHVLLSALSVFSSWMLMHTIFTMRYAHHYYTGIDENLKAGHAGGLDFPKTIHPGFLDFAYFSFIIGMTCQVSDVQVTSAHLRRLALLHGLVSFAFNTIVLALGVNVIAGML